MTQIYQYAFPKEKLEEEGNPQTIEFLLEEIVGTIELLDRAVELAKDPEKIEDKDTREIISDLEFGLLEKIRDAVEDNLTTEFPLHLIRRAISASLPVQRSTKKEKDSTTMEVTETSTNKARDILKAVHK